MMLDDKHKSIDPLEPFLLLAKNARGAAAAQLVQQVTEAPGVYVFGELLQLEGIKELELNETFNKHWKLLQIYAFGTFKDITTNKSELPISELQIKKLRLLTIATLASNSKFVPYRLLQESLDLKNLRHIEDLIIEAIYADILKGKINQKEERLEVDFVIGRDIQPNMIDGIISTLENWCSNSEKVMDTLEQQSNRANGIKEMKAIQKKNIEQQVEGVRKAIKTQDIQQEVDVEATSSQQQQTRVQKFKALKTSMKAPTSRTR